MPRLVEAPTAVVDLPGKVRVDEFFGGASCDPFGSAISVAHVKASAGFAEEWQTPAFDEYVLVLKGSVSIEHSHGAPQVVKAGQAVYLAKGEAVAPPRLPGAGRGLGRALSPQPRMHPSHLSPLPAAPDCRRACAVGLP